MSTRFLTKNLKQTAVYWGAPSPTGFGGYTFSSPVEINCRWIQKRTLYIDADGKEQVAESVVYVDTDVVVGGFLYLGSLDDLDSAPTPEDSDSAAYEIVSFTKTPNIKNTAHQRKVLL